MDAFFQSFLLIAVSEMGDKTQLLALLLAVRFKRPAVIMLGIFLATLLNHGIASYVGIWLSTFFSEETLRLALAILFFAFALWILVPDKADDLQNLNDQKRTTWHVLATTMVLFFLAEIGDKTQLATIALGAKFQSPTAVTLGTTAGMCVTNALAVLFGDRITKVLPMKWIRLGSSLLFMVFAGVIYWG